MSTQFMPRWVVLAAVLVLCLQPVGLGAPSQFNFAGNLATATGPATLEYQGDTATAVEFGTASGFGLPALPGGNATVMKFNPFTPQQGLLLDTGCEPNGTKVDGSAPGYINQYTMIWDLLVPDVASLPNGYLSLYQSNGTNSNDGDFFIRASNRGIGISGQYHGTVQDNTWHRIGLVFVQDSLDYCSLYKYIDGSLVGTQLGIAAIDGRWSLYPTGNANGYKTWLLADEDNETGMGYLASFFFSDSALTEAEMLALGGADADGVLTVATTHAGDANRDGKVDDLDASILAANWQRSGGATWEQADFNADGNVNDLDASILAANWQYGVGSAVPEPGTLVLLAGGVVLLLLARRRG